MSDHLIVQKSGPIATLLLDRAEKRNPISYAMWSALPSLLDDVANDDAIKVLVVRGAGDVAFSAGADIGEFERYRADSAGARIYNEATHVAERAMTGFPKPAIAMIHGFCIGGGAELALGCDFRFADTNARFGITPARLGIVYSLTATRQLTDLAGPAVARHILFSGLHLDAQRAFDRDLEETELAVFKNTGDHPLFGLAVRSRIFPVHVEAERARVDLRCPGLHQLQERPFESGAVDCLLEHVHALETRLKRVAVDSMFTHR